MNPPKRYRWAAAGDVNAFFGLMLDNVADLVLLVSILTAAFQFPAIFSFRYMLPGTAIGVLIGDLCFTWMAFRLARRSGREDVTAMPLGIDTPSTFGMVFFVLGPAFSAAKKSGLEELAAAHHAWQIGICCIVASGVFKLACAFGSSWVRRVLPRAGLLGSLAAIALVLISFLPLVDEVLRVPLVGFTALAIILTTLIGKVPLPFRVPGALGALLIGGVLYYLMVATGWLAPEKSGLDPSTALWPGEWLTALQFDWLKVFPEAIKYFPIAIPFALATVVGGIDCTESAASVGDEYHTGRVIGVEAVATLIAGCCGGVIQTTPYIGHPAYKAMGGRALYTLLTAIFIGVVGVCGLTGYIYEYLPKAAVFPILIFVGLEITAQSFHATPNKHYAAVALACVPAMAALVLLFVDPLLGPKSIDELAPNTAVQIYTLRMLAGGFVVTSLLWSSGLAAMIDRRLGLSAVYFLVAGIFTLFGVIHSSLPGNPLFVPWDLPALPKAAHGQTPLTVAASYFVMAGVLLVWSLWSREEESRNDEL